MSRLAAVLASAAFATLAALPAAPAEATCHSSRACVCWEETCVWMPYIEPLCVRIDLPGGGRTVCL